MHFFTTILDITPTSSSMAERFQMKHLFFTILLVTTAGCAASPETIVAKHRDPATYMPMSCEDMKARRELNQTLLKDYKSEQSQLRIADKITLLLRLPMFSQTLGTNREGDIAHLYGEQYALLLAANQKDCTL